MKIDHYESEGFKKVGLLTKDPLFNQNRKYGVQTTWLGEFEPKNKMGVYILASATGEILKIGESQNLDHRFRCYESHTGVTNVRVREHMEEMTDYSIYFIECPSYEVGFAGVKVPSGISYKFLEKKLLEQYRDITGEIPPWNRGIQ